MSKNFLKTTLFSALFLLKCWPVFAADKSFIIKGLERVDEQTLLSYININELKKDSPGAVKESINVVEYTTSLCARHKLCSDRQEHRDDRVR
jgi:hypothetical protein